MRAKFKRQLDSTAWHPEMKFKRISHAKYEEPSQTVDEYYTPSKSTVVYTGPLKTFVNYGMVISCCLGCGYASKKSHECQLQNPEYVRVRVLHNEMDEIRNNHFYIPGYLQGKILTREV